MAIETKDGLKVWQRRDRDTQLKIWAMWLVGTAIFMWSWQQISSVTTWAFFWDAPRIASDIGGRAWPPRWSYMDKLWEPLWDTLNIATLGTVMALMMAVPVAFMAARNTTPSLRSGLFSPIPVKNSSRPPSGTSTSRSQNVYPTTRL